MADNAAVQAKPPRANAPKRKLRWYQYSLRSLLIFTTVVAVACGRLGKKIKQKHRERDAVESLVGSGGYVMYNYKIEDWNTKPPGPDWLRGLLGENFFSEVEVVRFGAPGTAVSDSAMASLKELVQLRTLDLAAAKFSNSGLVNLEALTQLQELDLGMINVTDSDLEHLKGLTQLETLYLYQTDVTDSGLVNLKGLTKLQNLDLRMTKVTDAGLENLKGLTRLQSLNLGLTDVNDVAIKGLQKALPSCQFQWGRLW